MLHLMYSCKDKEGIWRIYTFSIWWQQWWCRPHRRLARGSCTCQTAAHWDGWQNGLYDVLVNGVVW